MLLRHDKLHGQKDVLSILALTGLPTRTRKGIHTLYFCTHAAIGSCSGELISAGRYGCASGFSRTSQKNNSAPLKAYRACLVNGKSSEHANKLHDF